MITHLPDSKTFWDRVRFARALAFPDLETVASFYEYMHFKATGQVKPPNITKEYLEEVLGVTL